MLSPEEKQNILEFGVMHIVSQGGPGWDEYGGYCVYQDESGQRCIVGAMLSDEQCRKFDIGALVEAKDIARKGINGWDRSDGKFLNSLQGAHDGAVNDSAIGGDDFFELFEKNLKKLCESHSLRYPEELI